MNTIKTGIRDIINLKNLFLIFLIKGNLRNCLSKYTKPNINIKNATDKSKPNMIPPI